MAIAIPSQHQALVLESIESGFQLKSVPTPQAEPGSAVVRILSATILSYIREVYNGKRGLQFPTPLVGGSCSIARVVSVGPDATLFQPGNLVYVDTVVRGRDDPNALFLSAIHQGASSGSKRLMSEVWRHGPFAEFAKVPLENCILLDEHRLCKTLGYSVHDLMYMSYLLVPFGGLRDIKLEPGETVVVSPATGGFGGAGVLVALALGARVLAMGRNVKELARLKNQAERTMPGACVETVPITGDEATDSAALKTFGTIDAVLDFSPPIAAKSNHVSSAIMALRSGGRVSLMGFTELTVSMWKIVGGNIMLKGNLMYSRDDMVQFVKLLERGRLPIGKHLVDTKGFQLNEWEAALNAAAEHTGLGRSVVFEPHGQVAAT